MFKQQNVKALSLVAIVLSAVGLLISLIGTLFVTGTGYTMGFFLGIISWSFLLWASIIGYQLSASYKLYDDEYKKVGIRVLLIIGAFLLFFFIGLVIGLVIAVILLGSLWALKRNYDEWVYTDIPYVPDEADYVPSSGNQETESK